MSYLLKTPILLLIFNRPDKTKKVFEKIRKVKPPRLYIAADGARESIIGEEFKVKKVRKQILNNIDWECRVETLFRKKNLGCKLAVSQAVTWFFKNEKQGIILEDDCLPSLSFFWFCETLLNKYKYVKEVKHISGANALGKIDILESYYFSAYPGIWGWATWADRWNNYDVNLKKYKGKSSLNIFKKKYKIDARFWEIIFFKVKEGLISTWDYQWFFSMWSNNGVSITPKYNLVSNIGFGEEATFTKNSNSELSKISVSALNKIIHPSNISINFKEDFVLKSKYFLKVGILKKIIKKFLYSK